MKSVIRFIILFLILSVLFALGAWAFMHRSNTSSSTSPLVYSKNQMLLELWSDYKESNIEPETNRTLDKQQDNISTSEGQSYSMLRSVWIDDQDIFDKSWKWTKDNLQREDKLMSWKFGRLPNGQYGIQDSVGGQNTATDGDSDIALSLLMAYSRWGQDKYLYDALPIINAMWEKEVVQIKGKPVLVANDLERQNKSSVIVNPSYFAPYAYKIFANVDKTHDWKGLADNSYTLLKQASDEALNTDSSSGLPPDWIVIDRATGSMSAAPASNLTTNFSYDAIRTPWRLALDWQWFKDPRDKEVLSRYKLLSDEWSANNKIAATYQHDGKAIVDYDSPATYGAVLGYFNVMQPEQAKEIYKQKLTVLYSPDKQRYEQTIGYYDENWAWFGMALQSNALPNLTDVKGAR